jgi:hypothetical protein
MITIEDLITKMPKVELHVHLEGSVCPETLLKLAKRHHVPLPAEDVAGMRKWYTFRDFDHFIEIYMTISSCLRTAEDIELIAREFLIGQAGQRTFDRDTNMIRQLVLNAVKATLLPEPEKGELLHTVTNQFGRLMSPRT